MSSFLPYIVDNGQTIQEMGHDTELAIAYLLSMNDNEPIVELVKTYYPFMAFETEKGVRVFDLLGHSESEIPLLVSIEINEKIMELAEVDEKKRPFAVEACINLLEDFHNETIDVKGLVDDIEIINYLKDSEKNKCNQTHALFQPIITEKRFHEIMNHVDKTRKETKEILKTHREAAKHLQILKNKIEKEHEKQYKSHLKESEKTLMEHEKETTKEHEKIVKEYNAEIEAINKEIDTQLSEKKAEYDKITQERDQVKDGEPENRKLRRKHDQALGHINKAIDNLEKERANKKRDVEQKIESKKKDLQEALENMRLEETRKQNEYKKKQITLEAGLDTLLDQQNQLITRLDEEEKTLSIIIDLAYVDGEELLVPFYIYRKGDLYGFHPPIKTSGGKGFSISLKSLIKFSLEDKIRKQVSPDTLSFNKYMEKVIGELSSDSTQSKEYKKTISKLNLLDSRFNLDMLLVGLYHLYQWGWLNDREYILAQKQVIERIGNLATEDMEEGEIDPTLSVDPLEITV
jgi:DNA repair exonuclease SbcCD ATPase subunit